MKLSDDGFKFILGQESLRTEAYKDQVGVWTIGVGHTGPEVKEGLVWPRSVCLQQFRLDIRRFEDAVSLLARTPKVLTGYQFDALVSFTFNVGVEAFRTSTLLKLLQAGRFNEAANEFTRWNKATKDGEKVVLPVLTKRRKTERNLFLTGSYGPPKAA